MQSTARLTAAAFVLAGGLIHLDLWRSQYESIPKIGPLFLLNVVASAVLAAALLTGRARGQVLLASGVLTVASAAALVVSRTVGLLGFMEGWTPDAIQALAAEIGAIVALAAVVAASRPRPAYLPARLSRRSEGSGRSAAASGQRPTM